MKKTVIMAIVVFAALLAGCFAYIKHNYPYALYFGDRLTGTYSSDVFYGELDLSLGGMDVHEISCIYDGENVRVDTDDKKHSFSIKGNEYGKYRIYFTIRKGDILKDTSVALNDDFKICVSLVKNKNQIDRLNLYTVFFCDNGEWYVNVSADRGPYRQEVTEKLDASLEEIMLDFGV